jgi:hypothetical protein
VRVLCNSCWGAVGCKDLNAPSQGLIESMEQSLMYKLGKQLEASRGTSWVRTLQPG